MDNNQENLFSAMKREKLSDQERESLRSSLLFLIKKDMPAQKRSFYGLYLSYAFIAVLVFASGIGISYASLPGDLLYPVKISVIEPIQKKATYLGFKADEVSFAEKRLQEIVLLSEKGRLNDDTRLMLYKEALSNAKLFEEKNKDLSDIKVADSASKLQAAFYAHAEIMEKTSSSTGIVNMLKESAVAAERIREKAEDSLSNVPEDSVRGMSQKKIKDIKKDYSEVENIVLSGYLSDDQRDVTEKNLKEIKEALESGRKNLESGDYSDAIPKLLKAERAVYGTKIMITTSKKDKRD